MFTIPILAFTMSDPGVHVGLIRAFTFDRSGCSRWAATRTLKLGVADYRFVRRYRERHAPAPLTLRQVDPLIRELTHYLNVIARKTQEAAP